MTSADSGLVVESFGRRVVVRRPDGDRVHCKLRGRKLEVVVGDEVQVKAGAPGDDWLVVARLPQRNVLRRTDSRGLDEAIAANLDQLAVVVAPVPPCDPYIVDRYVAGAGIAGIDPLVVVNKQDLHEDGPELDYVAVLNAAGIAVEHVSARNGSGLAALRGRLAGKRTLFAGQSGVGKSSLYNVLAGTDVRATRELSAGSGEGRHTTVSSAIVALPWGELVDSPGVRDYAPPPVPPRQVQVGFAEIARRGGDCRFLDCLHQREPNCAVQAAVAAGEIDARRYDSYRRLLNLARQLDERRGWRP